MSRHFLDSEYTFGKENHQENPFHASCEGILGKEVYSLEDDTDGLPLPEDTFLVTPPEEIAVVMPTGALDASDPITAHQCESIDAIVNSLHLAQEDHRGLSMEEFVALDEKGFLATSRHFADPDTSAQIYAVEALDDHQSKLITDETQNVAEELIKHLVGTSISTLDDKWFSIDKNLKFRIGEISKLTALKDYANVKTHYKEEEAVKVAEGVLDGAKLIGKLLLELNAQHLLKEGTDKALEAVNKDLEKFTKDYADYFFIDHMEITKDGSAKFTHIHFDHKVGGSIYSPDGKAPSALGWKNDTIHDFVSNLTKTEKLLETSLGNLGELAKDAEKLPDDILKQDTKEGIHRKAEVLMFIQAVLSCISYILGRVVDWGGNWCKECAFRLYH